MKSTLASLLLPGRTAAALLALTLLAACAGGETTTDTTAPTCGDGLVTLTEECDDANTAPGDGCNDICEIERNFECTGVPSSCVDLSGDTGTGDTSFDTGADTGTDTTIDDTTVDDTAADTTSDTAADTTADTAPDTTVDTTPDTTVDTTDTTVDDTAPDTTVDTTPDTTVDTTPDTTVDTTPDTTPPPVCGDGVVGFGEGCDDGNLTGGDGCSDLCVVEARYACSGSPSLCVINLCAGVSCGGLAGSCEVATCNPATGLCEVRDDADGATCSDGNLCTTGDVCTAGNCAGSAVVCADSGGGCSTGICNPGTGACDGVAQPDCTGCAGGGFCAGGECGGLPQTPAYTFESATDAAAFAMTGNQPWRIDTTTAHTGTSALRSGTIGNSQTSTATLTVNLRAAAQLRFWVKASTESCCDELSLSLNGVVDPTTWAGTVNWTEVVRNLPAGPSTLAFTYTKDSNTVAGTDTVSIDDLTIGSETTDACTTDACGEAIFNGTDCLVCAPVSDGTSCDASATDCTLSSCQAGSCISQNAPDCADCGTGGTCGGGTCFGPDEFALSTSFAAGSALAPLTSTAPAWAIDTTQGYAGGSSIKSGAAPASGASTLTLVTTTTAGQGLSFWYKVGSEPGYDFLRFKVDGTTRGEWSGTVAWTQFTTTLTAGAHTLVWEYRKDGSTSTSPDAGWIDELRITSPNSCAGDLCSSGVPVGGSCFACLVQPDGTDCDSSPTDCTLSSCQSGACLSENRVDCATCGATDSGICGNGLCRGPDEATFSSGFAAGSALAPLVSSAPAWAIDTTQGYAGGSALKSGAAPASGASTLTLVTTTTAGQGLSFWYKVGSEATYDFLRFKVDGVTRGEWSGTVAWTQFTTTLPAGTHTLVWEYRKDGSGSTTPDAAWIDELRITSPNTCGDDCSLSVDSGAGCVACAPPLDDCTACNGGTEVCISGNCGGLGNTGVAETFESATWPAAFTSTSTSRWTSDGAVPTPGAGEGLRSAKSGNIGGSASTAFQRTFTVGAGGSLAFKYRVSSEANYDFLKVTVDGTEVLSASGTVAWTDFSRALTAGSRTVVWTYSKDGITDGGSDDAWVDLIRVTDATSCAGDSCGNAGYDGGACLTCDPTACY